MSELIDEYAEKLKEELKKRGEPTAVNISVEEVQSLFGFKSARMALAIMESAGLRNEGHKWFLREEKSNEIC